LVAVLIMALQITDSGIYKIIFTQRPLSSQRGSKKYYLLCRPASLYSLCPLRDAFYHGFFLGYTNRTESDNTAEPKTPIAPYILVVKKTGSTKGFLMA